MESAPLIFLLIDPDAERRTVYRRALAAGIAEHGEVREAATASEGLTHADASDLDGVFISTHLPEKDLMAIGKAFTFARPPCGIILLADPTRFRDADSVFDLADEIVVEGPLAGAQLVRTAARLSAQRTLNSLLARKSHDLRSPLNAVIGYSELLKEEIEARGQDDLTPEVERIRQAGKLLLDRIEDMWQPGVSPIAGKPSPTERDAAPRFVDPTSGTKAHDEHVRTVLVIDDEEDTRSLFARYLEKGGFHTVVAADGAEGLRRAHELLPAVITVDMMMPDMDGWDVLDALRNAPALAETPVIMLTGQGSERVAVEALKQGVADYLVKGDITAQGLCRAVEGALEQQRLRREVEAAQQATLLAHEALRENERRFRELAERVSDMISRHAPDSTILYASPASRRLFGYESEVITGQTVYAFIHPDDAVVVRQAYRDAVSDRSNTYLTRYRLRHKDGHYVWVETTGQIINSDEQEQIVAVTRDITERKKAEEQLAFHAEELARSNRDLEQFAYVASHDLQEPLRAVNGYLRLLQRHHGEALGSGQEKIERALRSVAYMQQLITDLLAYARLNVQTAPFTMVDLNAVLAATLEALAERIEDRSATVLYDDLPTVRGDARQLTQVLQNLLSNALKFARDEVPPEIHVTSQGSQDHWRIAVQDNGIGIEPAYADRVFAIFHRLNAKEDYPGTGIGLSICKRIIERHNGRVWVDQAHPQGSVFIIELPRDVTS